MIGSVEAILGNMYSGKSTELLRRVTRLQIAKKKVLLIKPEIDTRYDEEKVVTHTGFSLPCHRVSDVNDIKKLVEFHVPDAVAVDEIQFMDIELSDVITELAGPIFNRRIIAAGLDTDFRGNIFETTAAVALRADEVTKLRAICTSCGDDACRTQRLINNQPVTEGAVVQVGGQESYEARCRQCFIVNNVLSEVY